LLLLLPVFWSRNILHIGRKEHVGLEDSLTNFVDPSLEVINVLMKPYTEYVVDIGKIHLSEDTAGNALRFVGKRPPKHAGYGIKEFVELLQTESQGTRK